MQFTSTPRSARLARRLVSHRLHEWGHPYDSTANETVTLIAAELVANAVRHGHVPGRDFHLRLAATPATLRIDVTDTRTEKRPHRNPESPPPRRSRPRPAPRLHARNRLGHHSAYGLARQGVGGGRACPASLVSHVRSRTGGRSR
ncbi:ATP-binding protein [Streptomyces sp. NPDC006208]|uniref:ATP-binding protein n=1 Tax=Streptomyces sp. NPDC006208 TaxID=3156734 RepID=UPI0033BA7A57